MYTDTQRQETAPIQYIQAPEQHRLNTATSSNTQITSQPISEIRQIINRITIGTQTLPLETSNMEERKTLIKNILTWKT